MTTTTNTLPDRPAQRRTPREWRALLRAYARGRQSRQAFCAHHGVALSTFDWWRRRVREETIPCSSPAPASARAPAISRDPPTFLELTPVAGLPLNPRTAPRAVAPWDVELELGGGVVLRLRRTPC